MNKEIILKEKVAIIYLSPPKRLIDLIYYSALGRLGLISVRYCIECRSDVASLGFVRVKYPS